MATITKRTNARGQATYRASIRRVGFPQRSQTFSSKKAAESWARKVEADLEALCVGTAPAERVTLAEAAREYLVGREADTRTGAPAIPGYSGKDRTREQRVNAWVQYLGDVALARISPDMIRRVLDQLERRGGYRGHGKGTAPLGRPLSGSTLNRYLAALSVVCKHGMQHHGLVANPCHRVAARAEGKPRDRVLTDDEQDALLEACRTSEWERLYLLALMGCATGARKGELLKLRWRHVDWKRRAVTFYDTKNSDNRLVPLPDVVMEELQSFAGIGDSLIFASTKRPSQPMVMDKHWHAAVARAGLASTGVLFHTLRHSAVTRLANASPEGGVARVAKLVGHRDLTTTMRYFHPDPEASRDLSEVLAKSLTKKGEKDRGAG